MKKTITIVVLFLVTFLSYAQQDSQFTHYMYNTISINPAYAGSRESMNIFALHRTQWLGLDGAPVTNSVSIHAPINDTNLGLGLSLLNDQIGPSVDNTVSVDFSYTLRLSDTYKLSFGLKTTLDLLNIDFTKLNQYQPSDYVFQNNIDNKFSPNIGVGFYLHSDYTYFGLSAPNLIETKYFDRFTSIGNSLVAKQVIHCYFIAGHVFDINEDVKFKPSVQVKLVYGAPLQLDFSGNFMISDKFMVGVSYRLSKTISSLVGFQATDNWFIGYGYDLETTRMSNYNLGSHEIFLRCELFNNYNRITSPRFF